MENIRSATKTPKHEIALTIPVRFGVLVFWWQFFFLLLPVILSSCKGKISEVRTYYDEEQKQKKEIFQVKADSQEVKHGAYELYSEEGKLLEKHFYSDNHLTDTLYKYFPSGIISEKAVYKNGLLNGTRQLFFESGGLMILENYADGEFEGPYKNFFADGKTDSEGQFVNGAMDGLWKYYYETGELKEEVFYRNNEENGPYKSFHRNGANHETGEFADEKKTGHWKEWDEKGNLMMEGDFLEGNPEGIIRFNDEKGNVKEEEWKVGNLVSKK